MGGMKQKKANKHKNKGNSGGGGGGGGAKSDASGAKKPVTIADISPEFQTIILDFLRSSKIEDHCCALL